MFTFIEVQTVFAVVYVVDVVVPVPRRMDRVQERMLLSFLPFAWIDVGGLELVARN